MQFSKTWTYKIGGKFQYQVQNKHNEQFAQPLHLFFVQPIGSEERVRETSKNFNKMWRKLTSLIAFFAEFKYLYFLRGGEHFSANFPYESLLGGCFLFLHILRLNNSSVMMKLHFR